MVQDIVREFGFLTLGTRFKRIGDALQAQTQTLLAQHGIDMPAAHFPLLAALHWHGPLGVGELGQAVGVSQPVVTRSLHGLQERGLVQSLSNEEDRRVRKVAPRLEGEALVTRARRDVNLFASARDDAAPACLVALAAMAGERMRFAGGTEISGVCTHPDFRGLGLARRLSAVVAQFIQQCGDQPFCMPGAPTMRPLLSMRAWAFARAPRCRWRCWGDEKPMNRL